MPRIRSSAACVLLTVLVLAGGFQAGPSSAATDVGSIHFTAGGKSLTGDWALSAPEITAAGDTLAPGADPGPDRQVQPSLGLEVTWGRQGWPVLLAIDVIHSYDDGMQGYPAFVVPAVDVRRRARTIELGVGARRAWTVNAFSPTVGAGGVLVRGTVDYTMRNPTQDPTGANAVELFGRDTAFGFWLDGALYWNIGSSFQMGVRARFSKATLTLPEPTVVRGSSSYYFRGNPVDVEGGGRHVGLVLGWSFPSRK